ncbi:probable tyrosyl-DNA phosphodiesterase [Nilaparvata lugens]|uniref:probable tyrosyl-DNA phosphodiesterase n=1 Tax=Nilaparvata lugens TaxID=108931 RepID=UPI00193DA552|nr:probable tyrosyl-DNA phosphodiesterase [Nilaparvata lugens]XP_022191296.2 probable tyrosyl-DNA phosphodiesterase [Nilaparvata lugens]
MSSRSDGPNPKKAKLLVECEYKELCYRQNPSHFQEFSHSHLEKLVSQMPENEFKLPPDYNQKISRRILELQVGFIKQIKKTGNVAPSKPSNSNSSDSKKENDARKQQNSSVKSQASASSPSPSTSNINARASSNKQQEENYRRIVLDRVNTNIADKWKKAAPYYVFLSAISDSKPTHKDDLSIQFPELLDPRLGDLKSSLQINFMVELGWLLAQYCIMGHRGKPLTLVYEEGDEYIKNGMCPPFVNCVKVSCPSPFGKHHTKMMIMCYCDESLRVIVSTGNLVESDWDNRVQGMWISPRCPRLPENADTGAGDSPTAFKKDLLDYLSRYQKPELQVWIDQVRSTDFSSVNVFFVASVPGTHSGPDFNRWSQGKVASILKKHATIKPAPDAHKWPIIAQCSSLGSFGPQPTDWLAGQIRDSLSGGVNLSPLTKPSISVIYPSFDNVCQSYDSLLGGGCLPYMRRVHDKQPWLNKYLCQWKSDHQHRTRSMPHIKTYCRVSPCRKRIAWFFLTSANLSKAAWGNSRSPMKNYTMSYEAGVMFIPKFLVKEDYFPIKSDEGCDKEIPLFPMPYDLPLVPYKSTDVPWFMDNLH